ncbi:MAG: gamma-glutamylcyclotransferase family protein [Candidatus Thorarchaeota archaeon]
MANPITEKEKCDNLFVYGTLQHGQSRNYILRGLKYEKAFLRKHKKVTPPSLGFPFIIRDESSNVEGEIYYGVGIALIKQLDLIEGEGELYHRIIVEVELESNEQVEAFTYYPSEILIKKFLRKPR